MGYLIRPDRLKLAMTILSGVTTLFARRTAKLTPRMGISFTTSLLPPLTSSPSPASAVEYSRMMCQVETIKKQ